MASQCDCSVCGTTFQVRFRYQMREDEGGFVYLCSQRCLQRRLSTGSICECCDQPFELEFPWQVVASDSHRRYFCSMKCRSGSVQPSDVPQVSHHVPADTDLPPAQPRRLRMQRSVPPPQAGPRRIAVFNHKGGTGKTTTSVNLAAGLAEAGKKVLLVDADGQGNVGASLGINGEKGLYHVLVHGADVKDIAVPVRKNLDVVTSNETLAAAELHLAAKPNRDRIMRERLGIHAAGYDVVILDCAPALSLMNQNALVFADSVLVPVACDYLSLVGVKQVLRTLSQIKKLLRHDVDILGVLPTFFDKRNRISRDALAALQKHFKERCLAPIRSNTKLKEAPSAKQTIFEYAPRSSGAQDYRVVVDTVLSKQPTQVFGAPTKSYEAKRQSPSKHPIATIETVPVVVGVPRRN